jgi:hypothetical protein
MKNNKGRMKQIAWLLLIVSTMLAMGTLCPPQALAQVPARFYWKTLSDANAVPLIVESISGNTNPFDFAHTVTPGADFDATMALAGYARTFSLFDRSAMAAIILPMGRISGDVTVAGKTFNQSTSGFGDPMLEFDINVLGPRAQKNIPDVIRYEPGISVDLLVDLAFPIGEYDNDQPLNIGQNRWYGRLGFPIIWQLGSWVPGKRTTLEFLPAVWFFGDNDGASGEKLDNFGFGLTLGYQVNNNLNLTFSYMSTVNDDAPGDLRMDKFMVSLVFGWHPLIEGSKRLKEEK